MSQKRIRRELRDYGYQHTSAYTTSFLYKGKIVEINHNNHYPFFIKKIYKTKYLARGFLF